jgi:sulfur-oxidizing protein SoxY
MPDHPLPLRRRALPGLLWAGAAALCGASRAQPPSADQPEASPRWRAVRASLWGERPIELAAADRLTLSAPARAPDPAFVPVAMRSAIGAASAGLGSDALRRLTLVIDQNPSPIAAVFDLPPDGALPDLETRVRVDEYSFVRVIGETADGRLWMALRYVKAAGGCSAPAGGDEAQQAAAMGRMLFRTTPATPVTAVAPGSPGPAGAPVTLDWTVQHPNHSGMAMDQLTRQYTPAHYVRSARLWQGERLLLAADLDFALSENPSLRLRFVPRGTGPLRAEVVDTQERRFSGSANWPGAR